METYLLKNTEYTHLIKQRRLGGYEIIHTDTSAQLGYTVSFTSVHAGKYTTEDKLKIQTIQKLNTTQGKQTQCTQFGDTLRYFFD